MHALNSKCDKASFSCDPVATDNAKNVQPFLPVQRSANRRTLWGLAAVMIFLFAPLGWAKDKDKDVCPRFQPGSTVQDPPNLFSSHGRLVANLVYQTEVDENGLTRFCFSTPDGRQSPTLHVNPGDELILHVTNRIPADAPGLPQMKMMGMEMSSSEISAETKGTGKPPLVCGASMMTSASVNVHYHGTNVSPTCHSDEVIRTTINSGESFTYNVHFPWDEPAGLYWYHPHIHGISEAAVQGGATGLIVVHGIADVQPAVIGLRQRLLAVRDNLLPNATGADPEPAWDVSLNYVPVPYPKYPPAAIEIGAREKQFWRLANTAADTILQIELLYDGVPQTLQVVGLDGVPVGSQDGTRRGRLVNVTTLRLSPAGRAEFIVTGPSRAVRNAVLVTRKVNTGPDGDSDPARPLATLKVTSTALANALVEAAPGQAPGPQRFEGLAQARPTLRRELYFSENNPLSQFFITEQGEEPKLFDPNAPPAIITHQGSVEDWTIQNRTLENHEFHMHQIHFLLLKKNGQPLPSSQQQYLDTIDVPFWSGSGPYPSVTVRMDFRGPDVGDFVYHCHILEHEDGGMMQIIRVLPKK
jgi:FtsP/CotA-like multicopper oxidase with cupredoxin domain